LTQRVLRTHGEGGRREQPKLGLLKRLLVRLGFSVYVGHRSKPGWTGELPFYAFRCNEHGVVIDYPHGFHGVLYCPLCMEASG